MREKDANRAKVSLYIVIERGSKERSLQGNEWWEVGEDDGDCLMRKSDAFIDAMSCIRSRRAPRFTQAAHEKFPKSLRV